MPRFTLTVTVEVEPLIILSPSGTRQQLHDLPADTEVLSEIHNRLEEACQLNAKHGLSHDPTYSIQPVGVSITPAQGYSA